MKRYSLEYCKQQLGVGEALWFSAWQESIGNFGSYNLWHVWGWEDVLPLLLSGMSG